MFFVDKGIVPNAHSKYRLLLVHLHILAESLTKKNLLDDQKDIHSKIPQQSKVKVMSKLRVTRDYGDGTIIHFWNVEQKIEYTITLILKDIISSHRLNNPQPCIIFIILLPFIFRS